MSPTGTVEQEKNLKEQIPLFTNPTVALALWHWQHSSSLRGKVQPLLNKAQWLKA
jgi:hypothetical protein